jgi:hypothetical protein
MRKHILAYDYMPIGTLLASLCKNKSIYERMLMTWRAKDRWLRKDPKVLLEVIEDHFDGLASFVNIRHFGILKGSGRPL